MDLSEMQTRVAELEQRKCTITTRLESRPRM